MLVHQRVCRNINGDINLEHQSLWTMARIGDDLPIGHVWCSKLQGQTCLFPESIAGDQDD